MAIMMTLEARHNLAAGQGTVWIGRGGFMGLLISSLLVLAQPAHLSNPAANILLVLAGLGLGAGAGLAVRMIRAATRRDFLAPPDTPGSARRTGGDSGTWRPGEAAGSGPSGGDEGDAGAAAEGKGWAKRLSRVKGLSRSLRNRAGR